LRRVILGHLSRECNSPELALAAVRRLGLDSLELYCAEQNQVSPQFQIGQQSAERPWRQDDSRRTGCSPLSEQINPVAGSRDDQEQAEYLLDLGWNVG
jgi:hypothetical protein